MFVPAGRYYLFSEPEAWTLMPTDEGSGQLPLTLDKGAYTLTADAAPTEPDEMQGMLRVYKLRPVALTLTDSSGNHAALSVSIRRGQSCGAAKLGIRLPQCR